MYADFGKMVLRLHHKNAHFLLLALRLSDDSQEPHR